MKLKNTIGVAVGTLMATASLGAMAQGQGSVDTEVFDKYYSSASERDLGDGNLLGGTLGYYLTDDVELALSYGAYHDMRSENDTGNTNIKGSLTSLDAIYNFGQVGAKLRPYVSAGFAHQSIDNADGSGRNHSTYGDIGVGAKYYVTDDLYAKASLDSMYNLDAQNMEWMAGLGVGMNFGGGSKKAAPAVAPMPAAPAPVASACVDNDNDGVCDAIDKCLNTPPNTTVDATGCAVTVEAVRVQLDVKFDFNKSVVKPNSYADIKSLADFMKQYPKTTTKVEGFTDSVGTKAYNQKLSERRADAVRDVLVKQYGVPANRVSAVGYGDSHPVASNATEEGRALNRRVEAGVDAATVTVEQVQQ